ncbi:MAG: DUF4340 domain-containing protein [Gammaproteobacteria bacterium]|jgi:hypothetical protein
MQKTIAMLAVLLVAQLALAVGMSLTGPELSASRPDTPLVGLGGRTVDRITIEGSDDQKLVLVRQPDGWVLPGMDDFPADDTKVGRLLDQLEGLKRGLAVATTEGAQKRFKVSEESFERRVTLAKSDETLATLYFGTSPGMRQVHARTSNDDAVYTAGFGLYDAPAKAEDWEDKGVLKLPSEQIASITLGELTLTRAPVTEDGNPSQDEAAETSGEAVWHAESLQEGETVSQEDADALAQKLASLTIGSVLGQEASAGYGLEAPVLALSVKRQDGETIEYRLGERDAENDYVLKVSSRPEYFRVPGYTAKPLIEAAARERLLHSADEATGADDAAQGPPDASEEDARPTEPGAGAEQDGS